MRLHLIHQPICFVTATELWEQNCWYGQEKREGDEYIVGHTRVRRGSTSMEEGAKRPGSIRDCSPPEAQNQECKTETG